MWVWICQRGQLEYERGRRRNVCSAMPVKRRQEWIERWTKRGNSGMVMQQSLACLIFLTAFHGEFGDSCRESYFVIK